MDCLGYLQHRYTVAIEPATYFHLTDRFHSFRPTLLARFAGSSEDRALTSYKGWRQESHDSCSVSCNNSIPTTNNGTTTQHNTTMAQQQHNKQWHNNTTQQTNNGTTTQHNTTMAQQHNTTNNGTTQHNKQTMAQQHNTTNNGTTQQSFHCLQY